MIPFAQTEAERERARDPRPSLEARYASRDAWAARLAEAVDRLVAERLLLPEDRHRLTIAARESWDVYRELYTSALAECLTNALAESRTRRRAEKR